MARGKTWTKEDDEFLMEKWGLVEMTHLEQKLKRTEVAIRQRASVLKLGRMQGANGEMLTPPEVATLTNRNTTTVYRYIKKGYLKADKLKRKKHTLHQISHEDLLKFIEKHQDKWDSFGTELYAFGIEPKWLQEKRKSDAEKRDNSNKKWTSTEESSLINLVGLGWAMKDIARNMNRSTESVYKKAYQLRKKGKLKPTKIMLYWTDEEVEMMLELKKQGLTDKKIAYELGREEGHVSDKRRRLKEEGLYNLKDEEIA